MTWFYSKNGQQLGPINEQEFSQKCFNGEILTTDLVWKEGMSDWMQQGDVASVSDTLTTPKISTQPQLRFDPQSNVGSVLVKQPPAMDASFILPKVPNYFWQSIVALVLSVVQTLFICLPIGLVCAIVAVVYASKVDNYQAVQNHLAADDASRNAKLWMILSFSFSILVFLGIAGLAIFVYLNMNP